MNIDIIIAFILGMAIGSIVMTFIFALLSSSCEDVEWIEYHLTDTKEFKE